MLNKPKFMSPSINMYGNTVIDLNSDTLPFSCIIDGNETITDFQIVVSKLSDNTVVFDTGMRTLGKPFFPINNRNQNVVFTAYLKDYFAKILEGDNYVKIPIVLNTNSTYNKDITYYRYNEETNICTAYEYSTSTLWQSDYSTLYVEAFVNSADAYYWTISFKNSNSGTETYSAAEVFYANSIPETVIYYSYDNESFDSVLSTDEINKSVLKKRKIYFKSTYNQAENIPIKRYGWRLTDATNNVVIMDTISQNQIYGIADDISCVCNGLINGTSYLIELYIETQNGHFGILQSVEFDVNYTVKNIDADFEIMALNNAAGIMLNWGNLRTTEGVVVGKSVSYIENSPVQNSVSIEIPEDTSVVFSGTANGKELEINEDSYVVLSFQFNKTQNATLFEMSGTDRYFNAITRKLVYTASSRELKYTITKGDIIASYTKQLSDTVSELCWYVITLYPLNNNSTEFKLIESVAEGGLFPSEELYPEEDLYPYLGEWNALREEVI